MRQVLSLTDAQLVRRFREQTVVVVGDVCLDRYIFGRPVRLSREAPIPVLEWSRERALPGAAANPALNVVSLGGTAHLVGLIGTDAAAEALRSQLEARGADPSGLVADIARRTTEKTRVLAEGLLVLPQQLARIDRADPSPILPESEAEVQRIIAALASRASALLVSDYKGGVVTEGTMDAVLRAARENGALATVDSQGDLFRFAGFDCVRCNRADAEAVLGRPLASDQDFERHVPALCDAVGCGALVVTRDADGLSYYSAEEGYAAIPGHDVPIADAVGAGDTFIAVLTLVLAAGGGLHDASRLANAAAALVVRHIGNACLEPAELLRFLHADE